MNSSCKSSWSSLVQRYQEEIDLLFQGYLRSHSGSKGHVWIAEHGVVDTLTVEPPEGGQYEIAVRFKIPKGYHIALPGDKYSGYIAGDGFLHGRNTEGH